MSALEQALQDYLTLRRHLGHDLADAARLLPGFVAYLDSIGAVTVTVQAAVAWATEPAQPQTPGQGAERASTLGPRRMTAVRGFARYLAGVKPRVLWSG